MLKGALCVWIWWIIEGKLRPVMDSSIGHGCTVFRVVCYDVLK